jgi:radical SAM protein with 4Fe4S-binding SPASM domain
MTEEDVSKEDVFLKAVFSARNWETYFKRTKILSSPDPGSWDLIEFPLEIAVELSNYCNLRCVMCPVPDLKRKRGFMDEFLFKKIVEDLIGESGFIFLPQGFGESLLHPQWAQLINLARSMEIQPITVLTNGMLLSGEKMVAMTESVDIVVVTLDGSNAKTYESVRVNSSFERVTENIKNLLRMRRNSERPHCVIRIIRMQDTEREIETFRTSWEKEIGKDDLIQVSECIDWAGSVKYRGVQKNREPTNRHPCRMLWKNLTVYHDGQVSPCCYDAEGELIIGHILNQSLKEIWRGPLLRNIRNLHLTSQYDKIPICSRCMNWL